jgi:hypothetical protein
VVDLLPDVTTATVVDWLHHHPHIQVVSRRADCSRSSFCASVVFPEQGSPTIKWRVATLTTPGVGSATIVAVNLDWISKSSILQFMPTTTCLSLPASSSSAAVKLKGRTSGWVTPGSGVIPDVVMPDWVMLEVRGLDLLINEVLPALNT